MSAADETSAVRRVSAEANVDERLSELEGMIDQLRTETDAKVDQLRQALGALKKSVAQETQERQAADQMTARKIEELAVGGLHLEMDGLTWLIIGLVGTSVPDEIVWLASLLN